MITVNINGTNYNNVASVSSAINYDYKYEVKTLDGVTHKPLKGKKTNYTIVFLNLDLDQYDALKAMLLSVEKVALEVPSGKTQKTSGQYFVNVRKDELKGIIYGGQYFNTALEVAFERVDYDA